MQLSIGMGEFRSDGSFKRIQGNNSTKVGGVVAVGPFDKNATTVDEIVAAAVSRFREEDIRFQQQHNGVYSLRYHDGRPVVYLPDGSAPFTLEGYKNFKHYKGYEKMRLYICAESKFNWNPILIVGHCGWLMWAKQTTVVQSTKYVALNVLYLSCVALQHLPCFPLQ